MEAAGINTSKDLYPNLPSASADQSSIKWSTNMENWKELALMLILVTRRHFKFTLYGCASERLRECVGSTHDCHCGVIVPGSTLTVSLGVADDSRERLQQYMLNGHQGRRKFIYFIDHVSSALLWVAHPKCDRWWPFNLRRRNFRTLTNYLFERPYQESLKSRSHVLCWNCSSLSKILFNTFGAYIHHSSITWIWAPLICRSNNFSSRLGRP